MKVLMTADAVGGVWTYALELATALQPHGVHIVLAVMGPAPSATQRAQASALENVELQTTRFALEWMTDPWSDVERAGEWLQSLAQTRHVDLIHLNGYSHAALDWRQPVVVVAHSCVYSWWQAVHNSEPPPHWQTYRSRIEAGMSHASTVVAPTQCFLSSLRRWYVFDTPTQVIHNARAARATSLSQLGERLPMVFACGRLWDEAKNMHALDVASRQLPWPVYVAGQTCSPEGREVCFQSLRCLGSMAPEHVHAWLETAAIFAHPARYEPFGLAVLEAAQAGCALALADIPTLRELWADAAMFFDPSDPDHLHAVLSRLIEDGAARRELAAAAQRRARKFDAAQLGQEYAALYRKLISQSKTRAVA